MTVKFNDISLAEFEKDVKGKIINVQDAKLIPIQKAGDEKALTSIFLSALKYIDEFRKLVFKKIDLSTSGKIHVYTEIDFKNDPKKGTYVDEDKKSQIPDGLILVEVRGKIKQAAILEMKSKNHILETKKIEGYLEIAKKYNIDRLITVSNDFVLSPAQSPLSGRKSKIINKNLEKMRHLSWSYILTLARILLHDNDTNIADPDQVNIMNEVVKYFEYKDSGVLGFTKMKDGWKKSVDKIGRSKKESIKDTDTDFIEAVESWLQEERDMALILSRKTWNSCVIR
ncbi:MAG: hypothetical protein KAS17_04170 [Victivallaceae bacterium]|nr:hypothetical protein [Victivallaceae bacterium]